MLPQGIEEASLNAWPAWQQLLYDGWIVRLANGYTKRANSVTPLYPSTLPFEDKVAYCERLFRERGLPPIFRLTSLACPPGLDEALATRGYRVVDPTLVLRLDLSPGASPASSASWRQTSLEEWLSTYTRLSGARPENATKHAEIPRAVVPAKLPAYLADTGGEPAAWRCWRETSSVSLTW